MQSAPKACRNRGRMLILHLCIRYTVVRQRYRMRRRGMPQARNATIGTNFGPVGRYRRWPGVRRSAKAAAGPGASIGAVTGQTRGQPARAHARVLAGRSAPRPCACDRISAATWRATSLGGRLAGIR